MTIFSTHWLKGAKSATAGSILRFFASCFQEGVQVVFMSPEISEKSTPYLRLPFKSADFFQNAGSVRGAGHGGSSHVRLVYHVQRVRHSQKELNVTFLEGSKFNLLCKCKVQTLKTHSVTDMFQPFLQLSEIPFQMPGKLDLDGVQEKFS